MNRFLFSIVILTSLLASCKTKATEEFLIPEFANQEFKIANADIFGYDSEWTLVFQDSNKVCLLRTFVSTNFNEDKNNSQLFFTLEKSEKYGFKLLKGFQMNASGCDRPSPDYLYSDSVLIDMDTTSFQKLNGGKLRLTSELGYDTTLIINSFGHTFKTIQKNGELDTSRFLLSFLPKENSIIYPFKLAGGQNCGVYIGNFDDNKDYYLSKKGNDLLLIVEDTYYAKVDTIVFKKN